MHFLALKFAHVGKKLYFCVEKRKNRKKMEAIKRTSSTATKSSMQNPNWGGQSSYSRDEFMDELARQLGEVYGLKDIREAL